MTKMCIYFFYSYRQFIQKNVRKLMMVTETQLLDAQSTYDKKKKRA